MNGVQRERETERDRQTEFAQMLQDLQRHIDALHQGAIRVGFIHRPVKAIFSVKK